MKFLHRHLWTTVIFTLVLAIPATLSAQDDMPADSAKAMNAADLVKTADRAVGLIVKTARESTDPALKEGQENAKPFWGALKKVNEAVDKMARGLYLQDETFFTSLGDAVAGFEELAISFGMSGAKDENVKAAAEKLDGALSALRENFSKEAMRLKQGGELNDEERKQIDAIKAKQTELQKKLDEVAGKVGNNETLLKGIRDAQRRSQEVASCHYTPAGWAFAMASVSILNGWVWGWHWWWGPWGGWGPSFAFEFYDIYVDYVIVVDYDWAVVDDYVDLYDYDLDIGYDELDDAELFEANDFLEEGDFELNDVEMYDFAEDELMFEGEMDIIDRDEFFDYDMGDFDDMGGYDVFEGFDEGGFFDFEQ